MRIAILSLFEDMYQPFLATSLVRRAQEAGIVNIEVDSLFSYVAPKERIDAPTFGHGAGMLLRPDVIEKAIEKNEAEHGPAYKIFFSPQGKKLNQRLLKKIAGAVADKKHLMLLPARYEGMDARLEEHYADEIVSVGDFVLMGGDIPAMTLLEGLLRLIPGVVGRQESVEFESFSGPFVDYPEFTAPVVWHGQEVPEVIRSGNHAQMALWRKRKAAENTVAHHFEWLRSSVMSADERALAQEFIPRHYAALMHTDVALSDGRVGTTSVTSLDIHDIARSAKTYGLQSYFIVTPLHDQQRVVQKLLDFWHTGPGFDYNQSRFEAVRSVQLSAGIDEVMAAIEQQEGVKPLLIATSARSEGHPKRITYHDQEQVWAHKRPVLLVFGTGSGLTQEFLARCDYLLVPVKGFSEFNHLSVRSAAAIIFDRWLGVNIKDE